MRARIILLVIGLLGSHEASSQGEACEVVRFDEAQISRMLTTAGLTLRSAFDESSLRICRNSTGTHADFATRPVPINEGVGVLFWASFTCRSHEKPPDEPRWECFKHLMRGYRTDPEARLPWSMVIIPRGWVPADTARWIDQALEALEAPGEIAECDDPNKKRTLADLRKRLYEDSGPLGISQWDDQIWISRAHEDAIQFEAGPNAALRVLCWDEPDVVVTSMNLTTPMVP
jgi:hypothetical protein